MSKGENIFKRQDGRWEARYIRERDLTGKIRYGYCYGKTYAEAKQKVTARKAALLTGKTVAGGAGARLFCAYCELWLQQKRPAVRESTYMKYVGILQRHILPQLGSMHADAITAKVVNGFTQTLLRDGLSVKTVRDILTVVRSISKYISTQIPTYFPPSELYYPREDKKQMRVLSVAEQTTLTRYLLLGLDACRFGLLLALFTGIRIGELCALQWKYVDLKENTIQICATMQRMQCDGAEDGHKTNVRIGPPKSNTSIRIIPLPHELAALCRRMRPANPECYVLTGTVAYMEPRTLQYRLQKYTKECGLQDVHCHTLRHSFATRAVESGFELKSLSEILGHASTTITLDRYVHASMELKRKNMQKLAESCGAAQSRTPSNHAAEPQTA